MKPWLLNILACPIDKNHPLRTYFYRWETPAEEIEAIAKKTGQEHEGLKDLVSLIKDFKEDKISSSAFFYTEDNTGNETAQKLLAKTQDLTKKLASKIKASEKSEEELVEELKMDLSFLYRYLHLFSVGDGLFVCEKCSRWYPIRDEIPEMLPDELREEKDEMPFLRKWKKKIPKKILSHGKPFNLKEETGKKKG